MISRCKTLPKLSRKIETSETSERFENLRDFLCFISPSAPSKPSLHLLDLHFVIVSSKIIGHGTGCARRCKEMQGDARRCKVCKARFPLQLEEVRGRFREVKLFITSSLSGIVDGGRLIVTQTQMMQQNLWKKDESSQSRLKSSVEKVLYEGERRAGWWGRMYGTNRSFIHKGARTKPASRTLATNRGAIWNIPDTHKSCRIWHIKRSLIGTGYNSVAACQSTSKTRSDATIGVSGPLGTKRMEETYYCTLYKHSTTTETKIHKVSWMHWIRKSFPLMECNFQQWCTAKCLKHPYPSSSTDTAEHGQARSEAGRGSQSKKRIYLWQSGAKWWNMVEYDWIYRPRTTMYWSNLKYMELTQRHQWPVGKRNALLRLCFRGIEASSVMDGPPQQCPAIWDPQMATLRRYSRRYGDCGELHGACAALAVKAANKVSVLKVKAGSLGHGPQDTNG